ncbi:MAG: hypothetical protein V3V03_02660 [Hyphomonadaceae bacterium]
MRLGWRCAFTAICALALSACSTASYRDQEATEPTLELAERSPEYIAAQMRENLFSYADAFDEELNTDTLSPEQQIALQMAGAMGREDILAGLFPDRHLPDCMATGTDPLTAIVEGARQTSIVIINEAHDQPRHRAFIETVVKALNDEGYTIYAAETLNVSPPGSGPVSDELPLLSEGWYSRDPIFGRLIRTVKSLGMERVVYEETADQRVPDDARPRDRIIARETAQTDNLMAQIFTGRPDAKVIIHVGHSHVEEFPHAVGENEPLLWMAARLKAATGIDPFTISQTVCQSGSGDTEFVRAGETVAGGYDHTDALVGHPPYHFTEGRPDWRRTAGDVDVPVPPAFLGLDAPVIIEARRIGEPVHTVPEDRLMLRKGEALPLLLPQGDYRLEGWTKDGQIGNPIPVTIPG